MRDWALIKKDKADLSNSAYGPSFRLYWRPTPTGMHPFWEGHFRLSQDVVFRAICIYPLRYPPVSPRFKVLWPPIAQILYPEFRHIYPNRSLSPSEIGELHAQFPEDKLLCLDDCICTFYASDDSWVAGRDTIVRQFDFTVYFLVSWVQYVRNGCDMKYWPMQESPHTAEEIFLQTPFGARCPCESEKAFGDCHAAALLQQAMTQRLLHRT